MSPSKPIFDRPDYSGYDLTAEISQLQNFLARAELQIPQSFFAKIREGDVVDLYENPPSMKQLYCNSQFRKLCSYTNDQMASLPFTQLFWRSDDIQQAIIRRASGVAFSAQDSEPWQVPSHELIENFHPRKRTFQVNLGFLAPCFKFGTDERVGFISSLNVEFIFEWPSSTVG